MNPLQELRRRVESWPDQDPANHLTVIWREKPQYDHMEIQAAETGEDGKIVVNTYYTDGRGYNTWQALQNQRARDIRRITRYFEQIDKLPYNREILQSSVYRCYTPYGGNRISPFHLTEDDRLDFTAFWDGNNDFITGTISLLYTYVTYMRVLQIPDDAPVDPEHMYRRMNRDKKVDVGLFSFGYVALADPDHDGALAAYLQMKFSGHREPKMFRVPFDPEVDTITTIPTLKKDIIDVND